MKKIIPAILLVSILLYIFILPKVYPNLNDRALFGEMFGGINAFFSAVALIGVIYTVIIQREELKLQREELRLTREQLKRSAEAQEKSEQALRKQVESMEKAARLNGLSSILQYHSSSKLGAETGIHPDPRTRDTHRLAAEIIKQKIEDEIK